MVEFSKASEAKKFFDDLLIKVDGMQIKSICSFCPSFNSHAGYRIYSDCSPIYIEFENGQYLIIEYPFIDSLRVEFRMLDAKEIADNQDPAIKDYFNCSVDIYNSRYGEVGDINRTEVISLEYDALERVEIFPVKNKYYKWINKNIEHVMPTNETFREIKFIMTNGNSFSICGDSAWADGYILAWSTDAKESIIQYD